MRTLMRDALLVAVTSISTALLTRSFLVSGQNPAVAISRLLKKSVALGLWL